MDRRRERRPIRCSFCGHREDQVKRLFAGPGVYICDLCISLCQEVLDQDAQSGHPPKGTNPPPAPRRMPSWLRLPGWPFTRSQVSAGA